MKKLRLLPKTREDHKEKNQSIGTGICVFLAINHVLLKLHYSLILAFTL